MLDVLHGSIKLRGMQQSKGAFMKVIQNVIETPKRWCYNFL